MKTPRRMARFALVAVLVVSACRVADRGGPEGQPSSAPPAPREESLSPLLPLGEAHAASFRRAFAESGQRSRYVVALSPT